MTLVVGFASEYFILDKLFRLVIISFIPLGFVLEQF